MSGYFEDEFTTGVADKLKDGLTEHRFQMLGLSQGVGKTFISILAAAKLDPNAHILVISIKAKIDERSWEASIDSFNAVTGSTLTCATQTFGKICNPAHAKKFLDSIGDNDKNGAILIFDEIQEIRSSTGKIAKANIQFTKRDKIRKIIGLSATPRPNNPFEMSTYLILNGDYKSKNQFNNAHVVRYDDYYAPIYHNDNDIKGLDDLNTKINRIMVYVESKDKILPDVENHYVTIEPHDGKPYICPSFDDERHPFGDTEKRTTEGHYKQALKYYRKGWVESITALNIMLMEIISNDPIRKYVLFRLLNRHFEQTNAKPVIICYEFNKEKDAIIEICEMAGIGYQFINGAEKDQSIPENNRHAVITQYKAGGTGIEIKFAPTMFFYMPTFKYNNVEQIKGRNVRRGMTDDIHHYYITTHNKRDFYAWQRVHTKEKNLKDWLKSISMDELRRFLN